MISLASIRDNCNMKLKVKGSYVSISHNKHKKKLIWYARKAIKTTLTETCFSSV